MDIRQLDNWKMAIGLQAVDGRRVSGFLLAKVGNHVEGTLATKELEELISAQEYEENRIREADLVATRTVGSLEDPTPLRLIPDDYLKIHHDLFDGLYGHAGKYRARNIWKSEQVLAGDSVTYGHVLELASALEYDLKNEREFSYLGLASDEIISHLASFLADFWQIHPFGKGNTRTTAVFLIKYLRQLGFGVSPEPFQTCSLFFRNALVRANYNRLGEGILRTTKPLEKFLRNVMYGETNVLRNRELHVRYQG